MGHTSKGRNQTPEQAAELLAEYERREREGPDFMRQRRGSVIAEAPLVTLDRNERIRLIWKFRMLTRRSWVAKDTGKHRGVITRTAESVFGALMYLTEKYGRVFPRQRQSLRHISKTLAAQGHLTGGGRPYTATAVQKMPRGR
jgi:hypothetical protein